MERAGSAELAPLSAWPRPSPAYSLVKTRRLPCACSVCRGKPSVSWSGPPVSTLIRKVFGLRRYRPGRFVGEAAMTNAGPLAGTRRCISPHVFAAVVARSRRLLFAVRPMAPSMPAHKDHEKDVGAEACPRSRVEKKARDGGMFVGCRPQGAGVRKASASTANVARDLNPAPARHCPAWSYAARFVRASCSAARPSPSRS